MRYGHQRLSDVLALSLDEMLLWAHEIGRLVSEENGAGSPSSED